MRISSLASIVCTRAQEMTEDIGSAVGGFGSNVGRVSSNVWGSVRSGLGRAAAVVSVARADGTKDGTSEAGVMPDAGQRAVDVSLWL